MQTGHLIYKCGGIDKRTIEKFEKVSFTFPIIVTFLILPCLEIPIAQNPFPGSLRICPAIPSLPLSWWGRGAQTADSNFFWAQTFYPAVCHRDAFFNPTLAPRTLTM